MENETVFLPGKEKVLCGKCFREYEPYTVTTLVERFGEPIREIEVEPDIYPKCMNDAENEGGEGIVMEEE